MSTNEINAETTAGGCCGTAAGIEVGTSAGTLVSPAPREAPQDSARLPVVVIGAGPVGLAAAAQLSERGLDFLVLEAGEQVGASIAEWGHVRLFSPWRYNADPAAHRLLQASGWTAPNPGHLPTGSELVESYLRPLAALPQITGNLRLGTQVEGITRLGYDRLRSAGRDEAPFLIRVRTADGNLTELQARAVIDASGTWRTPNVVGATGLPAHGENTSSAWVTHALPDVLGTHRKQFAGKHTVVIGAGHSAATTLLGLTALAETEPGTRITWALRGGNTTRTYGGGQDDQLPARGALGTQVKELVDAGRIDLATGFFTTQLRPLAPTPQLGGIEVTGRTPDGGERTLTANRVVAATGYRPDHTITTELRLDLDPILGTTPALAPLIDPNHHTCGTVPPHGVDELTHPEPGYYTIGVKSYGRAPTFLLATGYEQARSVVAALAGDWDAAHNAELQLPETGVCSTNTAPAATNANAGFTTSTSEGLLAQPLAAVPTSSGCCG